MCNTDKFSAALCALSIPISLLLNSDTLLAIIVLLLKYLDIRCYQLLWGHKCSLISDNSVVTKYNLEN